MKKTFIAFALTLMFAACKKTAVPEPTLPTPAVYIVGQNNLNAKFWKNDSLIQLSNRGTFSEATDIMFSGNDLYILGYEDNVLTYWKNGITTNVTDGSYPVYPSKMAVKGTDVYIAGETTPQNNVVAVYWKNGVLNTLSNGTRVFSYALDIAISKDGDVYIAGSEGWTAKYWKNGTAINLTDGSTPATATAITIFDNDIYIGGVENGVVKYWKNGIATNVTGTPDPDKTYTVSSIFVSGQDVYLGGQIKSTSITDIDKIYQVAAYWKNKVATELTGRKAPAAWISSIAVYGKDVYAAGTQFDRVNSRKVGKYWKNGIPVSLTDSSKAEAGLNKIIVQ